jgi:hypothetical protein
MVTAVSGSAFPGGSSGEGAATPAIGAPPSRLLYVLLVLAAVGGAAVLFIHEPAPGGLYPPCVFHRYTGLHCPGCGSTRGLHALLHGRLWAAFRYNALMVLALPFLAVAFIRYTRRVFGSRLSPARRTAPAGWIWGLLALVIAYWVLRNLPFRPFVWLAPTDV